jgi:hypothetical protein
MASKASLKHHQKNTRFCLEKQGKKIILLKCKSCSSTFTTKRKLCNHYQICISHVSNQIKKETQNQLDEKNRLIDMLKDQLEEQKKTITILQDKLENIAIKAVQNPTTTNNTKNIQINNFLKNAPMLTDEVIQDNIQYLTLDHHVQGAEGYAKYAMEFPFKGRIVCVDVSRNKIKYKDGDGNVVEDVGFQKMMMKLCKALYGKSYDLSIEHLDKLAKKFTEKELEQYDYLAAAKAITMYSKGSESDFCRKIIKIISKACQ